MIQSRTTENRISRHTPEKINQKNERQIEASLLYFAEHPERIDERLQELQREWDVERAIQMQSGAAMLVTLGLSAGNRRLRFLPFLVPVFLIQHATRGWCPPLAVFRRLGVRTKDEILREYYALKGLRGDFGDLSNDEDWSPRERVRALLHALND